MPVARYLLVGEPVPTEEYLMAREDVAAGKSRKAKGKANEVSGAVKGDTSQQIKGKIQKGVGKVQEKLGRKTSNRSTKR
jgi:uncharacterized protein YjbJ (UPF0337 family)